MVNNPTEFRMVHSAIEIDLAFSSEDTSDEAWMKALTARINDLIIHDFNKLVLILYRLDIDEAKLRKLLQDQATGDATSAADILCRMIIERQIQKNKTKQQFRRNDDISEEEKW